MPAKTLVAGRFYKTWKKRELFLILFIFGAIAFSTVSVINAANENAGWGAKDIEVRDTFNMPVQSQISIYGTDKILKKELAGSVISTNDMPDSGELQVNALKNSDVAIKLRITSTSGGRIILEDYGKKNPVIVPLANSVKFVEIGAKNISFSSATVTIHYTDAELNGANENNLVINHWNGTDWETLPTEIDKINKTLSATTTSLSPFGVSTSYGYLNAMVARKVILDEPWGNYGAGNDWNPDGGTAAANWENGISVSQFVYLVLISKYGFPIQGATVTGYYTAANGSTNLFPFSGITDADGEFNKSTSLDNQVRIGQTSNAMGPNEGIWNVTINVTYNGTTNSVKRDFILGEYGCGRSATSCHQPAGSVAPKGSAMNPQPLLSQDPYIQGVQVGGAESTHIVYAGKTPDQTEHEGQILGLTAYPGITKGTSCLTCHRGYNQSGYDATIGYKDTGVVLTSTGDIHDANGVKCKDCHQNITYGGYEQRRYGVPQCYNSSCHANTINIPKNWIQSKNNSYSWNQHAHDTNQTIACIFCHGPYHNVSKPNTTFYDPPANGVTESEMCLNNCHKNQQYHNGTLQCTVCHSQAAHEIRFFNSTGDYTYNKTESPGGWNVGKAYAGKCSTCHQKPYFANLLNHTRNTTLVVNGSYPNGAGGSKQVSNPLTHSNALNNGTKWGNYWNTSNDSDPCLYCHGIVYNNVGYSFTWDALGHVWKFKGNNTVNSSISGNTYWCASCHWQFYSSGGKTYTDMVNSFLSDNDTVPPEITGNATYGANTSKPGYRDHSGESKDDATCKGCHGGRIAGLASPTITDFMHNVATGVAGGANCTACHDIGGSAGTGRLINFTATNDSLAIHKNLNIGATSPSGYPSVNFKCWACHGNGSEPGSGHPSNYKTPYNCTNCHVQGAGQNMNFTPSTTLLNITQHYWNGTNITTASVTSCYSCHNRTEMMVGLNLDPDGAASVYGGANGGNNSSSHYGKKRSDMAGWDTTTYCTYCHNTTTSNVTFYVSDFNNTIFNHTTRATTPLCTTCHYNGRIHNSTLAKPVSNDSYCSTCHGTGGTAATNSKSEHKTLYCTECHANNTAGALAGKDIHAIKYLTQSNTFTTTNSSAVNCVTCHQTTSVDSSLMGFTAFKIKNPMRHSDSISNGSVWDGYWTNTTPQTACIYCHNDTKHNATPLGRILQWAPNYNMYGSISSNGSCADCHWKGDNNYTQMNSALTSAGLRTPPEITNGTNWKGNSSNYYNHSLSSYADQDCKSCHGSLLSASPNMSEFMHNVATGVAGGANCTACHDIGGSAGTGRLINFTATNDSLAIHKNLNIGATSPSGYPSVNFKCWACHGNGNEPGSGHPSNYKTPYNCTNCHVQGAGQNMNFTPNTTILNVTQHYWNGTNITTASVTSCYSCHNRTEMMVGLNLDPDGAASVYGGANGGNNSSSHYGKKRSDMAGWDTTTYCTYCHNTTTSNATFYVSDFNNTLYNHTSRATTPLCGACHNNGRIHDSVLVKPVSNDTLCKTCHGTGGSALTNNKSEHKTLYCTECHANSSTGALAGKDIHGVRYLTQSNNFATSNSSAVNCTTCHQGSVVDSLLSGFTPYKISNPLHHSDNVFNGSIWGSYWVNTSPITACIYCHSSTLHNATPLGRILQWAPNYVMYSGIGTNTSCANCHYKGDSNYTAMSSAFNSQALPVPPEITNGTSWNGRSSNYYNHSFSTYTDQDCKSCHGSQLSTQTNMSEFQHTVAVGGGGPNCIICHDIAGTGAPSNRRINASAMKLGSMHRNLNSNAVNTTSLDQINKACWACHGDGIQPSGHPTNYTSPKICTDCHVNSNYNAKLVYQHYPGSAFSGSVVYDASDSNRTCVSCHNNSQVTSLNLTYGTYEAIKIKNATVSHYSVNRTLGESLELSGAVTVALPNTRNTTGSFGCNQCHSVGGSGGIYGPDYGIARAIPSTHNKMGITGISCQLSCHNSNPAVNVTLHDSNVGMYLDISGCYSSGCHALPSTSDSGGRRRR